MLHCCQNCTKKPGSHCTSEIAAPELTYDMHVHNIPAPWLRPLSGIGPALMNSLACGTTAMNWNHAIDTVSRHQQAVMVRLNGIWTAVVDTFNEVALPDHRQTLCTLC
jgi:hypothetical protein